MTLTAMRTLISTLQEEDYRTFVKALISVETENMNEEELDMIYYKYRPVMLRADFFISSGVPQAIMRPPSSPPPGPISIT